MNQPSNNFQTIKLYLEQQQPFIELSKALQQQNLSGNRLATYKIVTGYEETNLAGKIAYMASILYIVMWGYTTFTVFNMWTGGLPGIVVFALLLHLIAPIYTIIMASIGQTQSIFYYLSQPVLYLSYLLIIGELVALSLAYIQTLRIDTEFQDTFQNYMVSNIITLLAPYGAQVIVMMYTAEQAKRQIGQTQSSIDAGSTIKLSQAMPSSCNIQRKFIDMEQL